MWSSFRPIDYVVVMWKLEDFLLFQTVFDERYYVNVGATDF